MLVSNQYQAQGKYLCLSPPHHRTQSWFDELGEELSNIQKPTRLWAYPEIRFISNQLKKMELMPSEEPPTTRTVLILTLSKPL